MVLKPDEHSAWAGLWPEYAAKVLRRATNLTRQCAAPGAGGKKSKVLSSRGNFFWNGTATGEEERAAEGNFIRRSFAGTAKYRVISDSAKLARPLGMPPIREHFEGRFQSVSRGALKPATDGRFKTGQCCKSYTSSSWSYSNGF